ncbi:MAG: class I SAM-dependent methyltransferase [Magnetococcales bacterium]|nr:class I SAM-dependent methyltransferase [Magnetococcales bacterium]
MKPSEFDRMASQEADLWWYEARRRFLVKTLEDLFPPARGEQTSRPRILDLGSALGGNHPTCALHGEYVGLDLSPIATAHCRQRGVRLMVAGDAQRLPFADASFDLVVAFDIFEHLPDDQGSMREVWRVLRPGGHVLFNVPCFQSLFSAHDLAFDHLRRYRKRAFVSKMASTGLRVEKASYWSFFIFPAVFFLRKVLKRATVDREEAESDFQAPLPTWVERILALLAALELAWIRRGGSWPWGVSLYGLACRPAAAQKKNY